MIRRIISKIGIFGIAIILAIIKILSYTKDNYKHIASDGLKSIVFITFLFYGLKYYSILPDLMYISVFLVISAWIGSTSYAEKIPEINRYVIITGIVSSGLTSHILITNNPHINPIGYIEYIVLGASGIGGVILLAITSIIFSGITISILGYDINEIKMKNRKSIDDPYGDKHAQKILSDPDK